MRTDCNQLASITFSERRCFFFAALLVLFRFRLDRFVFFVLSLGAAAAMTPTPFSALPVFFACFFPFSFIFFYFGNRNETSGSHCWFYRPRFHFFPSKSVGIDLTGFSLVSLNVTGLIYGHLRSFIEVCRVFYGFSSFFFGPLCNGFGRPLFFSFTWFYRVWS